MNLIEAYKKAELGEKIYAPPPTSYFLIKEAPGSLELYKFIGRISYDFMLSDDWQIERKPLVWEGEVIWYIDDDNFAFPVWVGEYTNTEIVKKFKGKRTKIWIEEITE